MLAVSVDGQTFGPSPVTPTPRTLCKWLGAVVPIHRCEAATLRVESGDSKAVGVVRRSRRLADARADEW